MDKDKQEEEEDTCETIFLLGNRGTMFRFSGVVRTRLFIFRIFTIFLISLFLVSTHLRECCSGHDFAVVPQ